MTMLLYYFVASITSYLLSVLYIPMIHDIVLCVYRNFVMYASKFGRMYIGMTVSGFDYFRMWAFRTVRFHNAI